jgi:hypothetical protein
MRLLLTAAVFLFLSGLQNVFARIGDTPEKCIERYGKPIKTTEKGLLFEKKGKKIYITFTAGKADGVFLQKLDPTERNRALPIPEREIEEFLTLNALGSKWQFASLLPDGDVVWITEDSALSAMYSQTTCSIQVFTKNSILR